METVPSAVGEDYFETKLNELVESGYLILSQEVINDEESDFNEKDLGFYIKSRKKTHSSLVWVE